MALLLLVCPIVRTLYVAVERRRTALLLANDESEGDSLELCSHLQRIVAYASHRAHGLESDCFAFGQGPAHTFTPPEARADIPRVCAIWLLAPHRALARRNGCQLPPVGGPYLVNQATDSYERLMECATVLQWSVWAEAARSSPLRLNRVPHLRWQRAWSVKFSYIAEIGGVQHTHGQRRMLEQHRERVVREIYSS